jgi:hypothetical protein
VLIEYRCGSEQFHSSRSYTQLLLFASRADQWDLFFASTMTTFERDTFRELTHQMGLVNKREGGVGRTRVFKARPTNFSSSTAQLPISSWDESVPTHEVDEVQMNS